MKFQCIQCSTAGEKGKIVAFDNRADWMAHMKAHKEGKPLPMPIAPPTPPPPPIKREEREVVPKTTPVPLNLVYVYTGECPVCSRPIETLEVMVKGALTMVAYCMACKKQCESRQVIPVVEQFKSKK